LRQWPRPDYLWRPDHGDRARPAGGPAQFVPPLGRGAMSDCLLEVREVTRRFGGLVANGDVSLAVRSGELLGLIGPNGAGKSTLFNLIAGAFPPTAGRILFAGRDITLLPAPQRCRLGIARTFQVPRSFDSMTVVENVMVGAF